MRVLFLTGEFPPMQGGVGDCTNEIAQALAARGVEVCILTSTKAESGKTLAPHASAGVKDEEKSLHPSSFILHPSIQSWDWSSLRVISQTIREFNPDLVHIQFQTAAFGMHPAIYFSPSLIRRGGRGVRSAITFHDLRVPYLFPKAGRVREWITKFLARSCDAVIATNDEDYSQLSALRLKLLTLIPIGSNISTTPPDNFNRAAWRARLGVSDNETLLCYFGFLNEAKGGETLIRALALVPNAKLLMIGGQTGASDPTNAAYLARVKALIAELGLSQRVLWTDYAPHEIVTANFIASDLCVMPYREGASYRHGTLMAALAHGMPIVTTVASRQSPVASSTLPQLCNGENCLMVEPNNPRALADAIQRAVVLPELRNRIGAGARELAQYFTWDKIAQKHLALYQQLLT